MIKLNGNVVQFESFPNGETRLVHEGIEKMIGFDSDLREPYAQHIEFKYENDGDLIKLMFIKKYLHRLGYDVIALTIDYMPYSRMDRSEEMSPFTLQYVSEFINGLDFYEIVVVEPHSDVTPALLKDSNSLYINFDLIEKVKREVGFREDIDTIMFPDAGASKRYSKMKAKNVVIGNKKRDFKTGKIEGLELVGNLDAEGTKVIIVDDLSSYGGSFIKSAEKLYEEGFIEIYLLVAHAENSIFKGELFDHIDKVFTTDSLLTDHNELENQKFAHKLKVYPIGELI